MIDDRLGCGTIVAVQCCSILKFNLKFKLWSPFHYGGPQHLTDHHLTICYCELNSVLNPRLINIQVARVLDHVIVSVSLSSRHFTK
jgi:hypothetical protein